MKRYFVILSLIFSSLSWAQQEYGRQICKELSSEKFYGRGYIKHGDKLAAHYIADEFKKLGAKPLAENDYFQQFGFSVETFPNDIQLKINGKELTIGKDYIPHHTSGAFTGEWKFRTLSKNDLFNLPVQENIKDSLKKQFYNGIILSEVGLTGDSLKDIMKHVYAFSAFGNVLKITDKKLIFSVATADRQLRHAVFVVKNEDLPEKIEQIYSDVQPVLVQKHETQNVIATIPAKKKNAPYLFFTAHYDHLGGIGDHVYFPGASDNASGVAMLLSMAKHYKDFKPKYNLVFIAFAGEEIGLLGSEYYVQNPIVPLNKIKFLVNLDLMGNGEDGISIVNGSVFEKEYDLLQKINKKKNYLSVINKRGKASNSDHHYFTEAGVPSFFIYTLGKNSNYHDIFDEYEDLSFAKFDEIVGLLVDFVKRL